VNPPKRVLIIEDDPDISAMLTENFKRVGCLPLQAENRNDALKLMDDSLDAIVVDYMMTGMSLAVFMLGIQPLIGRPIPIVLCSAYDEAKHAAAEIGVPFLRKPFPFAALMQAISVPPIGSAK